jgi:thiol-disulfide isomerase/thioredoxin
MSFARVLFAVILGAAVARPTVALAAESQPVVPFIEDDYARALAEAKRRDLPLFVDAWAPWCHSCLSMKEYVYKDPALATLAPRFVWLEIDTEKDGNAAFVERFPIEAWPTLFFIDPRSEAVLIRRLGSVTATQLEAMAAEAEQAFRGKAEGWRAVLARADRLYGEKRNAEAATAYAELLGAAPSDWSGRGRAVESYLFALSSADQERTCAQVARDAYPNLRGTAAAVTAAAVGLDCAVSLPTADSERAGLIATLEKSSREVVASAKPLAAADDISGVYLSLHAAREDAKDKLGARAVAEEWGRFLDREAKRARSAEARAVFDSHRLTVALALGQAERAIAVLKASERDLPSDYNPPARLALAYAAARRYADAVAASDRALAKVYGPRRITVLRQRSEILVAKGDRAAARKALEDAVACAASLPAMPHREKTLESLRAKLAEIQAAVE